MPVLADLLRTLRNKRVEDHRVRTHAPQFADLRLPAIPMTQDPPCLCRHGRQAKRAPKPAPYHIALRGEPQGRTLVVRLPVRRTQTGGYVQSPFRLQMKAELLEGKEAIHKLKITYHSLESSVAGFAPGKVSP